MRIVVVEDGSKIRRGIINLIQKIKPEYQIVGEAANGVDGLNVISELQPDLVIADIRMPEMNGLEMLQKLKELGLKHKTVILSAFSDFSFAQQAINIGVSEYLLKPVTAEKLQKTLITIEQELIEEKQRNQSSRLLTVKHIFQDVLMGKLAKIKELQQHLNHDSWFNGAEPFALVGAYTGNKDYDLEAFYQVLEKFSSSSTELKFIIMDIEIAGLTTFLVASRPDFSKAAKFLDTALLPDIHQYDFPNLIMGWIAVDSLAEMHTKFQQLSEMLKWALVLGKNEMISKQKLAGLTPKSLVYPTELEKQAIMLISHRNFGDLPKICPEFLNWWQKEIYPPEQIIASFVRFISSITNAVKETDPELFKQIKQQEILERILTAVSKEQLATALEELFHRLENGDKIPNPIYSLSVVKALKLIIENYHTGITREEIATKLHITPEYLSMLFYKEVGESFTTYLKNYRIDKAKELLMNTEYKIYEIAEKVGYPDPKYFCRVFKEVTGVPAGEYQKKYSSDGS